MGLAARNKSPLDYYTHLLTCIVWQHGEPQCGSRRYCAVWQHFYSSPYPPRAPAVGVRSARGGDGRHAGERGVGDRPVTSKDAHQVRLLLPAAGVRRRYSGVVLQRRQDLASTGRRHRVAARVQLGVPLSDLHLLGGTTPQCLVGRSDHHWSLRRCLLPTADCQLLQQDESPPRITHPFHLYHRLWRSRVLDVWTAAWR